jgi:LysM repeat protein
MKNYIFIILLFLLSSCSEQEMAEVEYKSGKSLWGNEKVVKKGDSDTVVSKKLNRSSVIKDSKNSDIIKKKEERDFESSGVISNYKEVRRFEKKKIDHDNYPEGDSLVSKSTDNINIDQQVKKEEPKHNDRFIIVRSGDDIKTIADEYNMSIAVIAKANDLQKPYQLEVGQILKIPESKDIDTTEIQAVSVVPKIKKNTHKGSAVELHHSDSDFIKPVEGEIISSFGEETESGSKNEGVNFASNAGANVHVVASGTVIYASNQLEDYGNLVLVKHENSLVTTYAHLQQILVQKGQKVTVGDIVGKVGSSGNVSSPQLHFAVRKGKEAVDPMFYLK